jgi:hypothetical protein
VQVLFSEGVFGLLFRTKMVLCSNLLGRLIRSEPIHLPDPDGALQASLDGSASLDLSILL